MNKVNVGFSVGTSLLTGLVTSYIIEVNQKRIQIGERNASFLNSPYKMKSLYCERLYKEIIDR